MSDWLWLAVFAGGFLFTYRKAFLVIANDGMTRPGDKTMRAANAVLAMIVAAVWPLAIPAYILYRVATPTTPQERKADLDKREADIARMERELKINQDPQARARGEWRR